jgi:hypothetical protein
MTKEMFLFELKRRKFEKKKLPDGSVVFTKGNLTVAIPPPGIAPPHACVFGKRGEPEGIAGFFETCIPWIDAQNN